MLNIFQFLKSIRRLGCGHDNDRTGSLDLTDNLFGGVECLCKNLLEIDLLAFIALPDAVDDPVEILLADVIFPAIDFKSGILRAAVRRPRRLAEQQQEIDTCGDQSPESGSCHR